MKNLIKEVERHGLSEAQYDLCLQDIKDKMNNINDMDWCEIVNKHNLPFHPDVIRKASQTIFGSYFVSEYLREKGLVNLQTDDYLNSLRDIKQEINKEKRKLHDERCELQRLLREQARRESFIDLVKTQISEVVEPVSIKHTNVKIESDNDIIIPIADVHAGIKAVNSFNYYDMNEVGIRLGKYFYEIKEIQKIHRAKEAHVVLLGDLISGWIHPNLRLQNNENVIEQLKKVSVYIGDFIKNLSTIFENINLYSVSGNHSRLSPNKENQLKDENLDALVFFYLETIFKNCKTVSFHQNEIDDTIVNFTTHGGKLFYAVHGDKDGSKTVVQNLTLMTGRKPDCILLAHKHHNAMDSIHGTKIVSCGSVVGVDDYCIDNRITGRAEHVVLITSKKETIKCLYDINLDDRSNSAVMKCMTGDAI